MPTFWVFLMLLSAATGDASAQVQSPPEVETTPLGRRFVLPDCVAFVPNGGKLLNPEGRVDVLLHLHGAASVIEPAYVQTARTGLLILFNRKGLSSVYTSPFRETTLLSKLLDDARAALHGAGMLHDQPWGRITLSTFSAGFGGARELLKQDNRDRIDALVLADSLYCGYEGDPAKHQVDRQLMSGFERFALRAARGETTMVVSHSSQVPEGYASTMETADYLIQNVAARPVESPASDWPDGMSPSRRLGRGRFLVLGFKGDGPQDHMSHLREISRLWAKARELEREPIQP